MNNKLSLLAVVLITEIILISGVYSDTTWSDSTKTTFTIIDKISLVKNENRCIFFTILIIIVIFIVIIYVKFSRKKAKRKNKSNIYKQAFSFKKRETLEREKKKR